MTEKKADHPDRTRISRRWRNYHWPADAHRTEQIEFPVRHDEQRAKTDLSDCLDTTAPAQGLDDVIEVPEASRSSRGGIEPPKIVDLASLFVTDTEST